MSKPDPGSFKKIAKKLLTQRGSGYTFMSAIHEG
jgi:hypothetical protein